MKAETKTAAMDVHVVNLGTIFTFEPRTPAARAWIADNVPFATWFGGAMVVEHRFAQPLAEGMLGDGLVVL